MHQFVFLLDLLVEDERVLSSFYDQKIAFANELVFTYANIFIFLLWLNSSSEHIQQTLKCVYQNTWLMKSTKYSIMLWWFTFFLVLVECCNTFSEEDFRWQMVEQFHYTRYNQCMFCSFMLMHNKKIYNLKNHINE